MESKQQVPPSPREYLINNYGSKPIRTWLLNAMSDYAHLWAKWVNSENESKLPPPSQPGKEEEPSMYYSNQQASKRQPHEQGKEETELETSMRLSSDEVIEWKLSYLRLVAEFEEMVGFKNKKIAQLEAELAALKSKPSEEEIEKAAKNYVIDLNINFDNDTETHAAKQLATTTFHDAIQWLSDYSKNKGR